jgi:hypothetical protein
MNGGEPIESNIQDGLFRMEEIVSRDIKIIEKTIYLSKSQLRQERG